MYVEGGFAGLVGEGFAGGEVVFHFLVGLEPLCCGDGDFEVVLVVVEVDLAVVFVVADVTNGLGFAFGGDFLGCGGFSVAAHVGFPC